MKGWHCFRHVSSMPACYCCVRQLPCRWLPTPPGSLWHVRTPTHAHAQSITSSSSVPAASTKQSPPGRATRKPRNMSAEPVLTPLTAITDKKHQRQLQRQKQREHEPWRLGNEPTDTAVLARVQQCSSWQQVADLYMALPAEQAAPRKAMYATAPAGVLRPPSMVQLQHAVLLLDQLAQLYPSMTVWASTMMQSQQPSAGAGGSQSSVSHTSDAQRVPGSGMAQPTTASEGTGSMQLDLTHPQTAQHGGSHAGAASDASSSLANEWDVGILQQQQQGNTRKRAGKSTMRVAGNPRHSSSNSSDEQAQRAAVDTLASELVCCIAAQGLNKMQPSDISLMLSALAKLAYQDRALVAQLVEHLAASGGLIALRASPTALADTAWATAKLGHDPGPHWISYFLQVTSGTLPAFSAVACTSCMWALARWGFKPADVWLQAMYTRIGQVAYQLGPQGVTTIAWALAMLKVQVPRKLAELLMVEAQVVMPSMSGASLATFCWALASLKHRPPGFWVDEALATSLKNMPTVPMSARGVPFANLVWALCVWETAQPTSTWLDAFCRHAAHSMPAMSSRSLAVVLQGLADLGYNPKQEWVSFALEEFHKRGSDASPMSAVAVLWSVSRLLRPPHAQCGEAARAWRPDRKWLVRYAHILQDIADLAASQGFGVLGPHELVEVVVALADLRYHPGTTWLTGHAACCNERMLQFSLYQIRLIRNALSVMADLREADYLPRKGEVV